VSLVGFQARNHPQQVGKTGARDTVDERITPAWLWGQLHHEFAFTLDAAANDSNAKLPAYFDIEADGLFQPWGTHRVWYNPPYSDIAAWVRKASLQHRDGCPLIVMLLPSNRTEQGWWQDYIEPVRDGRGPVETRFIRRRVDFGVPGNEEGKFKTSVPFGSVLVIWQGEANGRGV
jgi:phage N-6-adenine-methyltransferase